MKTDLRPNARTTIATYNGRQYQIPEMWLAGFCSNGPDGRSRSLADAVAWWAWQTELAEREEASS